MEIERVFIRYFVDHLPEYDAVIFAYFCKKLYGTSCVEMGTEEFCEECNAVFRSKQIPTAFHMTYQGIINLKKRWAPMELFSIEVNEENISFCKNSSVKPVSPVDEERMNKKRLTAEMTKLWMKKYPDTYTDGKFFGNQNQIRLRIEDSLKSKKIKVTNEKVLILYERLIDGFNSDAFDYIQAKDISAMLSSYNKITSYLMKNRTKKKTVQKSKEELFFG